MEGSKTLNSKEVMERSLCSLKKVNQEWFCWFKIEDDNSVTFYRETKSEGKLVAKHNLSYSADGQSVDLDLTLYPEGINKKKLKAPRTLLIRYEYNPAVSAEYVPEEYQQIANMQ